VRPGWCISDERADAMAPHDIPILFQRAERLVQRG
jgi:hypothetical protein